LQCIGVVLILNVLSTQVAMASSLGDRFRNWVLDGEARAAVISDNQQIIKRGSINPISLDPVSMACLECHNGTRAKHIATKNADDPMQFSRFGVQVNHPVGMYYDDYVKQPKGNLRPRSSLDSNITLIDGMVTCVSCHQPKDTKGEPVFATASQPQSLLAQIDADTCNASDDPVIRCLACHDM
jgi:formate-dependent nitrite reductase cytochrome c552 subunit